MHIKSNGFPRQIICWYDLNKKEQADCEQESKFFKYKGHIYDLDDFCVTTGSLEILGWDAYHGTSYFSAILIKLVGDEHVIVGSAYW